MGYISSLVRRQYKEFSRRIEHRNFVFWNDPADRQIRTVKLSATDQPDVWKSGENWQRKLSNKGNSREFARMYGCSVPELYHRGTDLPLHLPDRYVIRPTIGHSSSSVFVMNEGVNLMDQQSYTREEIENKLKGAIINNGDVEFLVEEFLQSEDGNYRLLDDYKFYVFNGEIAAIMVINRTSPSTGFMSCYDETWTRIEKINTYYPEAQTMPRPICFDQMVTQVKKLSKEYEIFCRIDFYATSRGAVFGEFTPTPFKGKYFTGTAEKLFINYWDKYCKGKI
jgi:hypothetical protein